MIEREREREKVVSDMWSSTTQGWLRHGEIASGPGAGPNANWQARKWEASGTRTVMEAMFMRLSSMWEKILSPLLSLFSLRVFKNAPVRVSGVCT